MDLKIVSGVLVPADLIKGKAVIDYSRNEIVSGDLDPSKLKKERLIAPRNMRISYFDVVPCHTVSLRQLETHFVDEDNFGARPPVGQYNRFKIDSDSTNTRLTVEWQCYPGTKIEEISYMAIGPVSLPPEGPSH